MDSEQELIQIRNEVFQKIGRTLLNFQQIEHLLKYIIKNSQISGTVNTVQNNLQKRAEAVNTKTMGQLADRFFDETFQVDPQSSQPLNETIEPYISTIFTIEADPEFYQRKRQQLKALIAERNKFIHHLVPRFDRDSIESCREIEQYLDQLREKLIPEFNFLKSLIDNFEACKKAHIEFLNSEEGKKQFELPFIQQSPLVQLLLSISINYARPDGWTSMAKADQRVRQDLPEEVDQIKIQWGYKTIKKLMEASKLFDFYPEPTAKGGDCLLYRSKPELVYGPWCRVMNSLQGTLLQSASADGWALISDAQQNIDQYLADDFAQVLNYRRLPSLKAFIIESESFEVKEETNETGDVYDLYRCQ
jgi:hypothetical protein